MKHIHILGICGYTTGGLALMAKKLGYKVTGADEDAYPPMSTLLTKSGIPWSNSHSPGNLEKWGKPDLIIQGNQVRQDNPELLRAISERLKVVSDSEFFYELTRDRRRIVVTGTHGKTTTSALVAWILAVSGRKPGFRLGTTVKNFKESVRLGKGREFVFEGDEYTTTCNDRRPKFFHFHPHLAIINNIEWDHPDVFKTPRVYQSLFRKFLVDLMPNQGLIISNAEDKNVRDVVRKAKCRQSNFGLRRGDFKARDISLAGGKTRFSLFKDDNKLGVLETSLMGEHNVKNCLAAASTALSLGVKFNDLQQALKSFKGTSRRLEWVGRVNGVAVIDDYAHHPTKARETIAAVKASFPGSRVLAVYVPHTYSRTRALFKEYGEAFGGVDLLIIPDIEPARERHLSALVHSQDLVRAIGKKQKEVYYIPEQKKVIEFLAAKARPGDVILCMSVRGFDDLARKIVKRLKKKI